MNALLATVFSVFAAVGVPPVLTEGSPAPSFEVTDIAGTPLRLEALATRGPVVLAFFPKANTPGCSEELKNLTAAADTITGLHATIVAVSGDSVDTLTEFQKTLGAKFSFVADEKGLLMNAYNVKMPILNVARRRLLLIGQDKQIKLLLKDGDAVKLSGLVDKLRTLAI